MSRPRLIALLLALGTLVVFLPAGGFGFVNYDDPDYVTENIFVKNGLDGAGLWWAFTSFHASNWHPLTWISHMTDCALFGLNPGAMHFVNVLFHAANAALLFALLWRLTQKLWPAAFIAALFAWHPLHIESVAWISERKDVLSTFFALIALLCYAKYVEAAEVQSPKSKVYFAYGLLAFASGLLAKPMLVTLPFVMLLLDFWPLNRVAGCKLQVASCAAPNRQPATGNRQLLLEKWPFFLLSAGACVVTCLAQRGAMASLEKVAFALRLKNSLMAYAGYLLKLCWPENLAFFYPLTAPSAGRLAAAGVVLAGISLFAWRTRRAWPFAAVGWAWFLGTLVPVIGLVQVGEQAMADRYTYFPAIGIFIVVTFAGLALAERFSAVNQVLAPAALLVLAGSVLATENQLRYWRTDETLFGHAAAVTKDNEIAQLNLGVVFEKQGRTAEAMRQYRQALAINPRRAHTHNNIADLLDETGQPAAALAEYQTALRLDPAAVETRLNLGSLLVELQRFDEAAACFQRAAELQPADARPHYALGKSLLKQGRDAAAIAEFRRALELDPENIPILAFAARVLAADENTAGRDGRAALAFAARANDLAGGGQPMTLDALGMAYAETGDFTNAQACAQNVLDLAAQAAMKDTGLVQRRLELYKNQQPWRELFRATNAPVQP